MRAPFIALLSGTCVGLTFLIPQSWPLLLFACAPLIVYIKRMRYREAIATGFLFAFIYILYALIPVLLGPLPVEWISAIVPTQTQYLFGLLFWIVSAAVIALPLSIWPLFVKWSPDAYTDYIILPSAWILLEVTGAVCASLFYFSPQVGIHASFAIPFIGTVLADDIVIRQLSAIGGVYALSGCVMLANVFAYHIYSTPRIRKIGAYVAIALLITWFMAHAILRSVHPTSEGSVRVAALSTQVPASLDVSIEAYRGYLRIGRALYERAAREDADVILFPEGSEFLVPRTEGGALLAFPGPDNTLAPLITSGREMRGDFYLTRMEYYDFSTSTPFVTYKQFLLPLGEYVSTSIYALGRVVGNNAALQKVGAVRNYASGPRATPQELGGVRVGALFCNETMSPTLYARLAYDGAHVFLNAASHDWYHDSRLVYAQMLRAAQIRAAESHRPYVQSSNMAPAFALDAYGRIIGESAWSQDEVLIASVEPSTVKTPFARLREEVLLAPLFALAIIFIVSTPKSREAVAPSHNHTNVPSVRVRRFFDLQ